MTTKPDATDAADEQLGRPTKFMPQYCQMIVDFFRSAIAFREHRDSKGHVQMIPGSFPCLEDFADSIRVDDSTLNAWSKKPTNKGLLDGNEVTFLTAYTRAKELQKTNLLRGTMAGAYNNNFAVFLAKNIMNMKDETTVHTPDVDLNLKKAEIDKMAGEAVDEALSNLLLAQGVKKGKSKS